MATLTIENLPEEILEKLQELAALNNQSVSDVTKMLLLQALILPQTKLSTTFSPETNTTWSQRCNQVPQLITDIEKRTRKNPQDIGLADSTISIREDRNR